MDAQGICTIDYPSGLVRLGLIEMLGRMRATGGGSIPLVPRRRNRLTQLSSALLMSTAFYALGGGIVFAGGPVNTTTYTTTTSISTSQSTSTSTSVSSSTTSVNVLENSSAVAVGACNAVTAAPAHGTVTVSGGECLYTPTPGFRGNDAFTGVQYSTQVTQQTSQQVTTQVTTTTSNIIVGTVIIGTNTNINTNTNTNTNINTDNNTNTNSDDFLIAVLDEVAILNGVDPQNVGVLDMLLNYTGNDPALTKLANTLNSLTTTAQINRFGEQLREEATNITVDSVLRINAEMQALINARDNVFALASTDESGTSAFASADPVPDRGVWVRTFGQSTSVGRSNNADGYSAGTWGFAFGVDKAVTWQTQVGGAFVYARTVVDDGGDRTGSGTTLDSYLGTLYGIFTGPRWYVRGNLTFGLHEYGTHHYVSALADEINGNHRGFQYGGRIEVGSPIALGANVIATPLASLNYIGLDQNGYTENGLGTSLLISSVTANSFKTGVGGKLSDTFATSPNWAARPSLQVVEYHEFMDNAPSQQAAFANGPTFITEGVMRPRDSLAITVGFDAISKAGLTVTASYDADVAKDGDSQGGLLQVRATF